MNRLSASPRYRRHKTRWKRYEKAQPGGRIQMDVKFIQPIGTARTKHYQYTAIDDCICIRALRIYKRNNQKSAIQFLDSIFEKLSLPWMSSRLTTAPSSRAPSTGM